VNRDQLIRAIGQLAKARGVHFAKDTKKGKGSHYVVEYGDKWTTIQSDLNPGRIERCLKQLGLSMRDIR
jgi:hypothetical protein